MYICNRKLTSIGSDNGLVPGQHQAIIWTNAKILLIQTLEISVKSFKWNQYIFIQGNAIENVVCKNGGHFVLALMC